MSADDLHYLELTEVAHLVQNRKVSPVELTEAMLHRVESLEPRLHAYAKVTPEFALDQARKAEQEILGRRYRARCMACRSPQGPVLHEGDCDRGGDADLSRFPARPSMAPLSSDSSMPAQSVSASSSSPRVRSPIITPL